MKNNNGKFVYEIEYDYADADISNPSLRAAIIVRFNDGTSLGCTRARATRVRPLMSHQSINSFKASVIAYAEDLRDEVAESWKTIQDQK